MYCQNCGKEFKEKPNFCSDCGKRLQEDARPSRMMPRGCHALLEYNRNYTNLFSPIVIDDDDDEDEVVIPEEINNMPSEESE
ncbi:hypothetical protein PAMP_002905 [Pampus punctatissimus]